MVIAAACHSGASRNPVGATRPPEPAWIPAQLGNDSQVSSCNCLLFDPPEAWSNLSRGAPFAPTPPEGRGAQGESKAPPSGGGSAATRSLLFASEHGELDPAAPAFSDCPPLSDRKHPPAALTETWPAPPILLRLCAASSGRTKGSKASASRWSRSP